MARGRTWLLLLAIAAAAGFALDTYLVATRAPLPFDLPVARWVQAAHWGSVVYAFDVINATAGIVQVAVGAAAVLAVFAWDRRAGVVMALGAVSTLLDDVVKALVERHRPTAGVLHLLTPAPGFSYPSGHAVFFTWLSFMLALAIAPRVRPALRWLPWLAAAMVIALACLARVWAGEHWPGDVIGGVLLGLSWSGLMLRLGEQWSVSPARDPRTSPTP